MRRSLLPGLLVPAVVAALALVACGGDDDDATATTTTEETSTTLTEADEGSATTVADTTAGDTTAEAPPDSGDEDEGLGDPLVFIAELTPETEVPGPGDAGAVGRIEIESATEGEWCIDMEVTGLSSDVTDSHIHFGPEGSSGDVVIPIGEPTATAGDTETWTDVCVPVEEQLANEVVDAPQAFYANVHTTDHPAGAVRGQLEPSSIFDLTLS